MHQMCFSESGSAVYDKRIERCSAGIIGNGKSSSTRELIAVSFDKIIKDITRIKIALNGLQIFGTNRNMGRKMLVPCIGERAFERIDGIGI